VQIQGWSASRDYTAVCIVFYSADLLVIYIIIILFNIYNLYI